MYVCVSGKCGFFKRKQREQLIRKKRESAMLFASEGDDDVTGNDDDTGNDVIDEARALHVDGDDVQQDKHSVYDNDDDADAPW